MRDGVRLSANIFRPAGSGRYPTILVRTPYNKGMEFTATYRAFVEHGYAVVIQDVRGRYKSGGQFEPLNQEIADGDDTLNWIARQAWSDGAIGMYGGSYLGIAQWKAALTHNPHLKAIFPYVSGDDDYLDRFYSPGGAMKLGHRLLWVAENYQPRGVRPPRFEDYVRFLPTRLADVKAAGREIPLWQAAESHPAYDAFWKQGSVREHLKSIGIPVYSVGGWYDNYVESDLDAFSTLSRTNKNVRVMVGPWAHVFNTRFAGVDFGPQADVALRGEQLRWFDRWLKGLEPVTLSGTPRSPVRIFVMGINQWRDEDEWPLTRAKEERFFLGANGDLGAQPEGDVKPDVFVYDPKNPVPTMGGAVCCDSKVFAWGPMDQRVVEKRKDVLTYTTAPLPADVEVTGPVKAVLWVSSSAVDTDFTVKLVDVFPSGEARNLTDGILRMRYRQSLEAPRLIRPGGVYRVVIDAGVTSNVFRAGHRIRAEISSSNFPRFDRNLNTDEMVGDARDGVKATQTVFHDEARHSYLLLPVVPARVVPLTSGPATRYVTKSSSPIKVR
jgi:putative CocE/NonD family hydrolase